MTQPERVNGRPHGAASVVLSCEHASQAFPEGYDLPDADRRWLGTHWAYDLGAEAVTRGLAEVLGGVAVLARHSRLLVDVNRPLTSETLFRERVDGEILHLNHLLSDAEKQRRIDGLWRPYHDGLHRTVAEHPGLNLFSVHSFTPVYEGGPRRWMELGVLFDKSTEAAEALALALEPTFAVARNEPYSGAGGLMYSVQSAADRYDRQALEIEVRHDLLETDAGVARVVEGLAAALIATGFVPAR